MPLTYSSATFDEFFSQCAYRKFDHESRKCIFFEKDATVWLLKYQTRGNLMAKYIPDSMTEVIIHTAQAMSRQHSYKYPSDWYLETVAQVVVRYKGYYKIQGVLKEQSSKSPKPVQDLKIHQLANESSCIYDLLAAVLHGDIDAVEQILKEGVDIKGKDDYIGSAIDAAVLRNDKDLLLFLLDHGADVHSRGYDGSLLQIAADQGYSEIVGVLLEHGADPHDIRQGAPPLMAPVKKGDAATVQAFLDHDIAYMHQTGKFSDTPLILAIKRGHSEIARLFLELPGCPINAKDEEGCSAVVYAIIVRNEEILELLLSHDDVEVDLDLQYGNPLRWAIMDDL